MSPRRILRRLTPDQHRVRGHPHLRPIAHLLHDPGLWHFTRRSTALAVAVGLFVCWLPVPGHMLIAALACLLLDCNLPLAVALVWISNPLTIPPMFLFAYRVGAWILHRPPEALHIELSWQWLATTAAHVWLPLVAGSLLLATLSALVGALAVRVVWRVTVARRWRARRLARVARAGERGMP